MQLGVKAGMVRVWLWQVKLCDPLVKHGPYLSALEIRSLNIKHYISSAVFYLRDIRCNKAQESCIHNAVLR